VLLLPAERLMYNLLLVCGSRRHLSKPLLIIQPIELLLTVTVIRLENWLSQLLSVCNGIELRFQNLLRLVLLVMLHLLHLLRKLSTRISIEGHLHLPLLVNFTLR